MDVLTDNSSLSQSRAYVTALTNDKYIPGVMALARSLRDVGSRYPLVVLIPSSKKTTLINKLNEYGGAVFDNVICIAQPDLAVSINIVDDRYAYWKDTFFKLVAVNLTQFEKIVLIDSDMLVNQNIDCLFDKLNMSAVMAGLCERPTWLNLNSGLIVIEPSAIEYERLVSCIEPAIMRKEMQGLNAGDQDVFQEACQEWPKHDELHLPETYNCLYGMLNSVCKINNCTPHDLQIIHFVGKVKPWHHGRFFVLKMLAANILRRGDKKNLYTRLKLWQKYWKYCQPIK